MGHLDANQRPLRSHEYILVFSKLYRGSCYNPQMIKGKVHSVGNGKSPAHYASTRDVRTPRKTDLYHPKSVLKFNNTRGGRSLHPTQKPLDLMEWLVRTYSNRGDLILGFRLNLGSRSQHRQESDRHRAKLRILRYNYRKIRKGA